MKLIDSLSSFLERKRKENKEIKEIKDKKKKKVGKKEYEVKVKWHDLKFQCVLLVLNK